MLYHADFASAYFREVPRGTILLDSHLKTDYFKRISWYSIYLKISTSMSLGDFERTRIGMQITQICKLCSYYFD